MGNGIQTNLTAPLIAVAAALLLGLLNQDVLAQIWRYSFDDGTYSHAYLIPFISLYLIWQAYREGGLRFRQKPLYLGLLLQCLLAALYLFVVTAQLSIGYLSLLPLLLAAFYLSFYQFNRLLLASALLYLFAVPIWGLLTIPLQQLSIIAVGQIMSVTGIPTYIEGESFTIPNGLFSIESGCSGLRYLLVSLLISFLYITLYLKQRRSMLLFLSVAVIGALIANWVRITLLILIGYFTDMQSSILPDHNHFGWYIYIPFLLLLFTWGRRLEGSQEQPRSQSDQTHPLQLAHLLPVTLFLLSSSLLVSAMTPVQAQQEPQHLTKAALSSQPLAPQTLSPQIKGADHLTINRESNGLQVHHYYYSGRQLEYKASHFENHPLPLNWRAIKHHFVGGTPIWHAISSDGEQGLFSLYYRSGTRLTTSAGQQKRNRLINALSGNRESELVWLHRACLNSGCTQLTAVFAAQVNRYRKVGPEALAQRP